MTFSEISEEDKYAMWSAYVEYTLTSGGTPREFVEYCNWMEGLQG